MAFQDDLIDDASIFFDTDVFGAAGSYLAKGATVSSDVTVVVQQVQDAETQKISRGESYYAQSGRLWCQVSEISAPGPGDVFTVAGMDWVVQEVLGGNALAWELAVYRSAFAGKIR